MFGFSRLGKRPIFGAFAEKNPRDTSAQDISAAQLKFAEGNRSLALGQLVEAQEHFRQAVAKHPGFADAQCNLGSVSRDLHQPEVAEKHLRAALQSNPALTPALFNLAMLCIDQSIWEEAADLLRRYIAAAGSQAPAQYWLGNCEMGMGNQNLALKAYTTALRLDPNHVQARWGCAMSQLPAIADTEIEQLAAPKTFLTELKKLHKWLDQHAPPKAFLAVGAQQPYYLAYIEQNHRDTLKLYGALCASLMAKWKLNSGVNTPPPNARGKCRIGIVSAHIHSHSVWHAVVKGWIAHLNPRQFELHVFHIGKVQDDQTQWASKRVKQLHYGKGEWPEWAQLISSSAMDALIYPEIGMDSTTVRLSSLRLAPVQLAAWGHPITSGLPTIDAFISANDFEPPNGEEHYCEPLIRLPRLGCYYQAFGTKSKPVIREEWRIDRTDRILLCAGSPFKYSPAHDRVWTAIAKRCAPCKLVFFAMAGDHLSNRLQKRLRHAFESEGVDFDTFVRFIPWQPQNAFFGFLDIADVYLDTLGFSGFNTVMQAAERATPIVAFEGEFMRGRFASATLRSLGLAEWIANSQEDFIEMTVKIAMNPSLQKTLRQTIEKSFGNLLHDTQTVAAFGDHLLRLTSK